MIILNTLTIRMAYEFEAFFSSSAPAHWCSDALVHRCTSAPVNWCTSAPSVTVLGINIMHIAEDCASINEI